MIKIRYSAVDGFNRIKQFKSLKGARKYAQEMVGKNPSISSWGGYAVSDDGVGKIEVLGVSIKLQDLFGDEKKPGELPDGEFPIYIVHPLGKWFLSREEAEAEVKACVEYDHENVYGPYEIEVSQISKEDLS